MNNNEPATIKVQYKAKVQKMKKNKKQLSQIQNFRLP